MSARHAPAVSGLLAEFPALVSAECVRRGISQRTASKEIGLNPSSVTRIVRGDGMDARTFLAVVQWLGLSMHWLIDGGSAASYRRGWDDCAASVRAALDDPTASPAGP